MEPFSTFDFVQNCLDLESFTDDKLEVLYDYYSDYYSYEGEISDPYSDLKQNVCSRIEYTPSTATR